MCVSTMTKKTIAAMVGAYGAETASEVYYNEQVKKILDKYSAAEVAAAGIFLSKYMDRKGMTELGTIDQQYGKLLLPSHLQAGQYENNAQNMDGGRNDASLSANCPLLGQLSDENL